MQPEAILFCRIFSAVVFFITLAVGFWMARNFERLFGADPDVPSENSSSRTYTRVQIFAVWAHAVVLSAAFALLLH